MNKSTYLLKPAVSGVLCLLMAMGGLIPAVAGGSPSSATITQATSTPCFDPVPDPTAAGWTAEGGGTFQPGARLLVEDPGVGANDFKTFRCSDPTMFEQDGNITTGSFTVTVLHNFSGFLQPVYELPTLNLVNASQAIPVKFSLSGNKGLNIFAAGYPISSEIPCADNEPGAVIEETVVAGGSSLSYDAAADRYTYVWKTQKTWKGTCRILALRLNDGSEHFAKFRFK